MEFNLRELRKSEDDQLQTLTACYHEMLDSSSVLVSDAIFLAAWFVYSSSAGACTTLQLQIS
jgi:hypothetical protein